VNILYKIYIKGSNIIAWSKYLSKNKYKYKWQDLDPLMTLNPKENTPTA